MNPIKCVNCPHNCIISESFNGFCKTKEIKDDKVISSNYGRITALQLDPIEKKPLARFMPGSYILSIGSYGCNMSCPWCQNDGISRGIAPYVRLTPNELVEKAINIHNNIGIAYTYNEMLVSSDFVYDTAILAKENNLKNVLVTNGMASRDVFEKLIPHIDALNIDLKTIYKDKYEMIGGNLEAITENIKIAASNSHVEITTLIVPGFNDTEEEIKEISSFIASINKDIPLHISRFFPAGEMKNAIPTDVDLIYHLKDIALEKLNYVFTGNC